jgi:peptide/nickel transport system substrate-binding protein
MRGLRLAVVAAIVAAVGVFTVPAHGDPTPPVRVAIGPMGQGAPLGGEFDLADDGGFLSDWLIAYADCAKLVNYPDAPAPAGDELQGDAATVVPSTSNGGITNSGLTYTFSLRSGLGFAPPSSEQVTPDSFVVAIERFEKLEQQNFQGILNAIQGAAAYRAGTASSISGLSVSGSQLTITLTQPDPLLPAKLAMPMFCAVPVGTSLSQISPTPLPSAGPYYVDPATVTRDATTHELTGFRLLRNPNYGGSRPAVLPELDFSAQTQANSSTFVNDAINGAKASPPTTDWVAAGLTASQKGTLSPNYGAGSPPAAQGKQQYFEGPSAGTQYLVPNTTRPGLSDVRVRQALNYAVDRNTAAGFLFTDPNDQLTAPAFPGFQDLSLYPFSSDYATARGLMQQAGYDSGHHLALKIIAPPSGTRNQVANDLVTRLANIYVDLTVVTMNTGAANSFVSNPANLPNWDLLATGWSPDFLDGSDVIGPLLDGSQIDPSGNLAPGSVDYGRFYDPDWDPVFEYAYSLDPGSGRDDAWANLDANLMANDAPVIPLSDFKSADFFSPRVGCQVYTVYGIDIGRLCERTDVAAGGTVSTGSDTSSSDPVQTAVTSPAGGSVAVTTGTTATDVSGYDLLGQQVSIEAPASDAAHPLTLVFELDASALAAAGADANTVTVFRNGSPIDDCSPTHGTTADPDPCISSRATQTDGDAVLTVLTSHASQWNFGLADSTPPTVGSVSLSANPVPAGTSVKLSVSASSDATAAEFYVDQDNGAGLNLPLEGGAGSFISGAFGSNLSAGTHTLGIRVRDDAQNWTAVRTIQLTVGPPQPFLVGLQGLTVSGGSVVHGSVAGNGSVVVSGKSGVDGTVTVPAQNKLSVTGGSTVGGTVIGTTTAPSSCSGALSLDKGRSLTVSGTVCYATVTVKGKSTLKLAPGAVLYANSVTIAGGSIVQRS